MKSRIMKAVCALLILSLVAGIAFLAGVISANEHPVNHAETALRKTGLPTRFSRHYSLYGVTSGRDFFSHTVFQVEYSREELLSLMAHTDHWRIEKVSAGDFRDFSAHTWYPEVVQVADDIEFDAWYYLETSAPREYAVHQATGTFESIGLIGYGFEFAVFDVDTGLFIFIDQCG